MFDGDDMWSSTNQHAAVDVDYGQALVLDYLFDFLGRDGIDGSGGPTSETSVDGLTDLFPHMVHYGSGVNAATWTGNSIVYGDGDGTTSGSWVSLDIIAHEMMHGIVEYTADFIYYGESGALEESYGDIFAVMVNIYNFGETANVSWWIGEDVWTPGVAGDAIRMLDNPHLAPNSYTTTDPDHVSEMYNGTADNGGVHVNCGIPNKVFYLATKGGIHHLHPNITLSGIGIEKTALIWYRALTLYLSYTSDFNDARTQTTRAARDLYGTGSNESFAVDAAWGLCGVGPVPSPNTISGIANGDFETSSSPWVFNAVSGSVVFVSRGSFYHTGMGYALAGGLNSASGSFYNPIYIPSNIITANVSFWVRISTADNSGIHDTLSLELRDTSGTLVTTLFVVSNLDTTGTSFTLKGPFNIAPWKSYGNLRLQFTLSTNPNLISTFYVDTVNLVFTYY